jgi:photosystem II stability/assembly factor-like uncharacterized protein
VVGYPRLLRVRFASPRDGWGLTGDHALVATHDGGRTWRPVAKQPCAENPTSIAPLAIAPVSARHGWGLCSDHKTIEEAVAVYETRDGARS